MAAACGCHGTGTPPRPLDPGTTGGAGVEPPVLDPPARRDAAPKLDASPEPDGAAAPEDTAIIADAPPPDAPPPDTSPAPADAAARDGGPTVSPLAGIGKVELVKSGFVFVEGLRWVPALGALLVSDAYGETIYKLTPPDTFEPFRPMSNGANCIDIDPQGRLVTAEVGAMQEKQKGGVSRRLEDGKWVDAIKDYGGLAIGHPNDVVALPDGNIFFSDLGPHRLFRIDPGGVLSYPITTGEDAKMNGLGLSPDKKTFYAGAGGTILVYDVKDGALALRGKIPGGTDGMCLDQEGNLYATTGQGLAVWNVATGKSWGLIALPGLTGPERGTECAFADADARTLYVSAVRKLFRVRLAHPGVY
jgi:gluconolactonase